MHGSNKTKSAVGISSKQQQKQQQKVDRQMRTLLNSGKKSPPLALMGNHGNSTNTVRPNNGSSA